MLRITELKLPLEHVEAALPAAILARLAIKTEDLLGFTVFRRGYDSRKKADIQLVYTLDVELPKALEAALLKRFRDHTCRLFEKHGIKNIGYWVPVDEENGSKTTLIYVLEHASRDAAKESFKAFGADPEWQAARKASEEGGKILAKAPESIFMTPTDYSPAVKIEKSSKPRVFEMRTYTTPEGKLAPLLARFRDHTCKLFEKHGMTNLAYWTPTDADKGATTNSSTSSPMTARKPVSPPSPPSVPTPTGSKPKPPARKPTAAP